jgi:hypothetical protein
VVTHRARHGHRAAVGEDRHRERDIRQVRAAVVGVVQQERVAFPHVLRRKGTHDALCRELQRAEVDGDGRGLGDRLAPGVEERRRRVEALLHDR